MLTGASLSLIAVFGLGLGAIIRHTAAAITVVVGIVFVGGTFIGQSDFAIRPYLPLYIVSHSLGATGPACLGNAGSNTFADHKKVLSAALRQVPARAPQEAPDPH